MTSALKKFFLLSIVFMLVFSGCTTFLQPAPTTTPTPTLTSTATITPTPSPTPTLTPTVTLTPTLPPTYTPTPTNTPALSCNADQTLKTLKSKIKQDEFVILHNKIYGVSILAIWFVEPAINPLAKESEINANTQLAIRRALTLSQELKASDSCVSALFDTISAIVVDKNYNGWFSGEIKITDLPATMQTDEQQVDAIAKLYQVGYLRSKITAKVNAAPASSCTWKTAKKNIHNHFSPMRENVAFYFVLDDAGVNVWAQWDSPVEFLQLNMPTTLMNIAQEIGCLFPQPSRIIFSVVDGTGDLQVLGAWNWADIQSRNISRIQIAFRK